MLHTYRLRTPPLGHAHSNRMKHFAICYFSTISPWSVRACASVCVCGKVEAEVWLRPEIVVVFQLWIWLQFLFALLFTWLISCHLLLSVREREMSVRGGGAGACAESCLHRLPRPQYVCNFARTWGNFKWFFGNFFLFCIKQALAQPRPPTVAAPLRLLFELVLWLWRCAHHQQKTNAADSGKGTHDGPENTLYLQVEIFWN